MNDGYDAKRSQRRSSAGERKRAPSGARNRSHNDTGAKAQKSYDNYVRLARDAAATGDTVEMENCYQHAEHFFRVLKELAAQSNPTLRLVRDDQSPEKFSSTN